MWNSLILQVRFPVKQSLIMPIVLIYTTGRYSKVHVSVYGTFHINFMSTLYY